jgi:PAS domain S-box-containing protein
VAVVAPNSEIEDAVRKGYLRQFLLQGLVILVILLGAAAVLLFEMRWSRTLEEKVNRRTEELKKSEENYRSLVESAEDFIFTVDAEGRFQSMNSFTANFFGGPAEAFLGKDLSSLFPEKVAQKQLKSVKDVYTLGKSVRDEFEIEMGEHTIWISANFMPLKHEEGHVSAVLCIARDITESKNLERQLINTEKLASLGTLAAGVAHEVNNPLGVILGFCDLLLRKAGKHSQEYEDLKTIERQGLHCKQVVENLLSFARFGDADSEYSEVNGCIEDIIKVVKHTLEMHDIELDLSLSQNLPNVRGDSRQLQQVFLNLVNNAVSAMPTGGLLKIRTFLERTSRKAVIQIEDNGEGIKSENMDHIFEPFFTTKPEGEGTGLGLFVSYGIITKYGGTIDCSSHHSSTLKPRGTAFTIKLPTRA